MLDDLQVLYVLSGIICCCDSLKPRGDSLRQGRVVDTKYDQAAVMARNVAHGKRTCHAILCASA